MPAGEDLSAPRKVEGGVVAEQPQEQLDSNQLVVGVDAAESGGKRDAGAN